MKASIELKTTCVRNISCAVMLCGTLFVFVGTAARADALSDGVKYYKSFAVEHIGKAFAGAQAEAGRALVPVQSDGGGGAFPRASATDGIGVVTAAAIN